MPAIAIVEDHVLVRDGLIAALARDTTLTVVGAFSNLADLLAAFDGAAPADRPALVLLDLDLDGVPADPAAVAGLIDSGVPVLVVSAMASPAQVRAMMVAGVAGFVAKRDATASLLAAIGAVLAGESWTSPELAAVLAADRARPRLSNQEERVLALYASGLKLTSVARELGIKPDTAKQYIDRVRSKYALLGRDVRTKTELYQAAVTDGVIEPR